MTRTTTRIIAALMSFNGADPQPNALLAFGFETSIQACALVTEFGDLIREQWNRDNLPLFVRQKDAGIEQVGALYPQIIPTNYVFIY